MSTNGAIQSGACGDSERRVFIGGITNDITTQQVKNYFGQYGKIEVIDFKTDKFTGQSRGYGFITFTDGNVANSLLSSGAQHFIGFNKIEVKKVTKKSQLDCKIFIGGVSQDTTESDIRAFFSQFGEIVEFEQPLDKMKNAKKNFCFVTFTSPDEVKNALRSPKQTVNGKQVDVKSVIFNPETMGNKNERRARSTMAPYYGYDPATVASSYVTPSISYEGFSPAYSGGGYDYSALGYDANALGYVTSPMAIAQAALQKMHSKETKLRFTPY